MSNFDPLFEQVLFWFLLNQTVVIGIAVLLLFIALIVGISSIFSKWGGR